MDWTDTETVLEAVRLRGEFLEYASEHLRSDRSIVLIAVKNCGTSLRWASAELRNEKSTVLEAVKQNGRALKHASDELRRDRTVVRAAVEQCGAALEYADETLRGSRDVVRLAAKENLWALRFAAPHLRENMDFSLQAVGGHFLPCQYECARQAAPFWNGETIVTFPDYNLPPGTPGGPPATTKAAPKAGRSRLESSTSPAAHTEEVVANIQATSDPHDTNAPPRGTEERHSAKIKIRVNIIGAKGLRAGDTGGRSDPYCICEVPGKRALKFQTPVIKKTLNPVWNYQIEFADFSPRDSLLFNVWDKDMLRNDFLGNAELAASMFIHRGFDGELPLRDAGKGVNATLQVKIELLQ